MMRWTEKRRLSAESGFWKTICTARTCSRSRLPMRAARAPRPSSSTTEPSSGSVSPSSRRASVVLPLPDSPTRPSVSPGPSANVTSSTARHLVAVLVERLARRCECAGPACRRRSLRSAATRDRAATSRGQRLRLLVEVAAARVAAAEVVERRLLRAADVLGEPAAVGEHAAGQLRAEPREEARDRVEPALVLARAAARDAAQQARPCTGGAGRRRPRRPAPPRRGGRRRGRRRGRTSCAITPRLWLMNRTLVLELLAQARRRGRAPPPRPWRRAPWSARRGSAAPGPWPAPSR